MPEKRKIPKHIAIVMDGNGRWAKERGLPRTVGHRMGLNRVREVIETASKLDIKAVTFYAFSTENWKRSVKEVNFLMRAMVTFLEKEKASLCRNNIRFRIIGRKNPLSEQVLNKIKEVEELTMQNTGLNVVLAFNYGSRAEIVDAAKRFAELVNKGVFKINQLDEETFARFLYEPDLPEPDLFIRTSGELRLSNFLLWQLAYTELYFPNKYWPDFTKNDFIEAISVYQNRQRRFGRVR